jgi:hypothetical protein
MTPRRLLLLACLSVMAAFLASCGGGGSTQEGVSHRASPPVIARANSFCHLFRHEILELAHGALAHPQGQSLGTTLELTTARVVRPSIPLLKRMANRMQRLKPAAQSDAFNLYANLFDPFVVLTEKRLDAGREGDYTRSRGLEAQLTDLSLAQRHAARLAGIHACDVDFPQLLINSLTE